MNFGQTRSTRLAEKERKQREYKQELERQIEAKRLREQQERMQERQQSRDRLSVNHQRETVIPLASPNRSEGNHMTRSPGVPTQAYQQYPNASSKPTARPVDSTSFQQEGHFQQQQQQQQQHHMPVQQEQAQPPRQQRHDEAILQSEIQHSFQESADAPSYLRGSQAGGGGLDKPLTYQRHDDPLLKSEIQHSFQESADAPSYLQAPQLAPVRAQDKPFKQPSQAFYKKLEEERKKLAYGEELRQQMREQKERKERERRLWKFGEPTNMYSSSPARHDDPILKSEIQHSFRESSDAPSYLRSHVQAGSNDSRAPPAPIPMHGEKVLKNEYSHAYQQSSASPSRIPRHDDAILKSEIQHAFQESSDSPSYLRDHADKRQQPMVHFRSDYRDMTRIEIEAKQKKAQDLHNDLRRQMEEKRAAKQREKEERMLEEQKENERVRREQEQLRLQFEGENSRKHRSRKGHAAPFINLSSNEDIEKEAPNVHQTVKATPVRKVSKSETLSHPSFSIPEKPMGREASPVGRIERERERYREKDKEDKPSTRPQTPSRAGLSTPMVEKKIASSVDSIRDELVSNQEKVLQVINEQREALVAETESTRQEMLQMKNMLQEYQTSVQQMEKMHSEQMQMQNAFALIKQQEMEEMRQSREEQQQAMPPPPVEYERVETPSWVKQSMKQGNGMDLMQSLQADSTLVFPVHEQEPVEPVLSQSPLKASMDQGIIPVVENGVVDLRLDSESNYVSQEDEWQQHQAPPPSLPEYASGLGEARRNLSRNPSVASSVTTLNVEELYERNASKLKMLEDLEAVDDMDEIDRKLNQFLSTRSDSFSNPLENFSELDYNSEHLNVSDLMEPERLSTPCLPAESDWIS